jgi:hypothetical protein
MELLARYQAGDCIAVCDELGAQTSPGEVAVRIARELMSRVRQNLTTLATRWLELGVPLVRPLGPQGSARQDLDALEQACGPIPITVRALYEELPWINFVAEPPGGPWPESSELDPIVFEDLAVQAGDVPQFASSHPSSCSATRT